MPIFDRTGLKTSEKFRMPVMFLILLVEWNFDIKSEVKVLFFLKIEDGREKHITCITGF